MPKLDSLASVYCVAAVRENSGVLVFDEGALFVQRRCKTQMLTRDDLESRLQARLVAHTCMTPGVTCRCCTRLHLVWRDFLNREDGQTPARSTRRFTGLQ